MKIFLLILVLSALATTSYASMITMGSFDIAGAIYVTGAGGVNIPGVGSCPVGDQCIFWQDTASPANNQRTDIDTNGLPNGDIPLAMAGNSAGNMFNLTNPPNVVDVAGFSAQPFMSFLNGGVTTVLNINFIPAGVNGSAGCSASPPAAGQVCTPTGSLFNLENTSATSSTASWRFTGITNDSSSTWSGTFTSQFNTMSFQTVLAQLASTGFVSNTFSGQITLVPGAPVPEPETVSFLLLGSGMIACAAFLRRFSRR